MAFQTGATGQPVTGPLVHPIANKYGQDIAIVMKQQKTTV